MATIPIRDVPGEAVQPSGDELILIDNGIAMQKASINDAVTPKATEIADDKIAALNLGSASQNNTEDFATAAQGLLADSAVLYAPQTLDSEQQAQARANIGLGNSATRNVGTTSGTVAAGNDSRILSAMLNKGTLGQTDLNTIGAFADNGVYYQTTNAEATSQRNYPIQRAGTLIVTPAAFGCVQMYLPYNPPGIFVRGLTGSWNGSGPWGEWREVVHTDRTISTGTGLTGGGDLSADRTISLNSASIASLALADTAVQPSRTINAGDGLTGGGDLSADRTISLDASSIASLALADSAVQPADLEAVRVPAGGLTGQVLVKETNDDNDVGWATVAAATAVSYAPQTLSPAEQSQARANIDALGPNETADRAFRRGNILGTVSQSSGVPTGAIIERGSNANGEYVRFADGTQICWRNSLPASSPPNIAEGSIYRNNGDTWTYPASFVGPVSAGLSGAGANVRWATHSSSGNMSDKINVWMYSAFSSDTIGAYYGLYAFGRWY